MTEEEHRRLSEALRDAKVIKGVRENLLKAQKSLEPDDTKTSVQQAHDALEALLRELCGQLLADTRISLPEDKRFDRMKFTDYMKALQRVILVGSEQSNFYHFNDVRVAVKHQSGVKPHREEAEAFIGGVTEFMRRLGLWSEVEVEPAKAAVEPVPIETGGRESMTAKHAILMVLADRGEMDASSLYDEAQKYYRGDRRALMAARWRLEAEEDAIWFVQSRGVYKLRSETKRELESDQEDTSLLTGRLALLTALAQHNGELSASDLYDAAEPMCDCARNSLAGIRSQLEDEGLLMYIQTRDTYKLTRAGRQELES
jgi:hypothetical protein